MFNILLIEATCLRLIAFEKGNVGPAYFYFKAICY